MGERLIATLKLAFSKRAKGPDGSYWWQACRPMRTRVVIHGVRVQADSSRFPSWWLWFTTRRTDGKVVRIGGVPLSLFRLHVGWRTTVIGYHHPNWSSLGEREPGFIWRARVVSIELDGRALQRISVLLDSLLDLGCQFGPQPKEAA